MKNFVDYAKSLFSYKEEYSDFAKNILEKMIEEKASIDPKTPSSLIIFSNLKIFINIQTTTICTDGELINNLLNKHEVNAIIDKAFLLYNKITNKQKDELKKRILNKLNESHSPAYREFSEAIQNSYIDWIEYNFFKLTYKEIIYIIDVVKKEFTIASATCYLSELEKEKLINLMYEKRARQK